ncbi:hypothetical protein PIECOFPK_00950 [Mycovorax composti]|jgi:hypothetical protein|uniref:Uncharacterized protein n=2 Tax=Chitinophagaceae TaxID=563835 RepID=A0ABZ2EIZ4_9BACT
MIPQSFKDSLSHSAPPSAYNALQSALWHAAKGNWNKAHQIAQQHEGAKEFDRLHAFLHRQEGDDWNANYWYRRVGIPMPSVSLEEELSMLIQQWIPS